MATTQDGDEFTVPARAGLGVTPQRARNEVALKILCALMANPARYEDVRAQVAAKHLTQEQATAKNVNKAFFLAEAFLRRSAK